MKFSFKFMMLPSSVVNTYQLAAMFLCIRVHRVSVALLITVSDHLYLLLVSLLLGSLLPGSCRSVFPMTHTDHRRIVTDNMEESLLGAEMTRNVTVP